MINLVQNSISGLCDTLSTTFRDELTFVYEATKALYLIPSFANDHNKLLALGDFFSNKENVHKASVLLFFQDKDWAGYAECLYIQYCMPGTQGTSGPSAGPSTTSNV